MDTAPEHAWITELFGRGFDGSSLTLEELADFLAWEAEFQT